MPLAADVTVDSATWAALTLTLTILGAVLSWVAWRRRGLAAGVRGLAWTLVPVAAWLTGTLRLAVDILNAVIDWAGRLAFSPTVWLGMIVAGVAVALWFLAGLMRARGLGVRDQPDGTEGSPGRSAGRPGQVSPTKPGKPARRKPAGDDLEDMDDIEAILKRHGI